MKAATICCVLIGGLTDAAAAQDATTYRWEIQVHAGALAANHPRGGDARLPDAGAPFPISFLGTSRRVSSWYFGDGALLLAQVGRAFGRTQNVAALDPVLNSAAVERRGGASFGVSLTRRISDRWSAELQVDSARGQLALRGDAAATVEASRASFLTAIGQFLITPFAGSPISSVATLRERAGRQLIATGAVNVLLRKRGRAIPYVVGGGGVLSHTGGTPSISLQGNYAFQMNNVRFINESDTVDVRYTVAKHVAVGVVGGGLRWSLPSRWVLRFDARGLFSRNTSQIVLDATPSSTRSPNAVAVLTVPSNPGLQFSSSTMAPTSLSGPNIQDFVTFSGSGIQSQFRITAGLGWRF